MRYPVHGRGIPNYELTLVTVMSHAGVENSSMSSRYREYRFHFLW